MRAFTIHKQKPIMKIKTYSTKDLKNQLRSGPFAWPGGYPLYFITDDCAALSFDAVSENLRSVLWSIRNEVNDGWRVIGCDVNWEDASLYCDHTGKRIESAYAEDAALAI